MLGSKPRLALAVAAAAVLTSVAPASSAGDTGPPGSPDPAVGPLYAPSVLGVAQWLSLPHYCTAGVVHSPGRNLLITAAHCVIASGVGMEFVPGYHGGIAPYGAWDVVRAYVDPRWTAHLDPHYDVAFLQVAGRVEEVVGGHSLGRAPPVGRRVDVSGYLLGSGDDPVSCTANAYYTDAYPTFDCTGFADGTSGSPWLADDSVVGVIGGLQQGGCTPSTSYSAPFGPDVQALYERAIAEGTGDLTVPLALLSSC